MARRSSGLSAVLRSEPGPAAGAGVLNMGGEYQRWKAVNPDAADKALSGGLIGSPETIRRKLRKLEASRTDR